MSWRHPAPHTSCHALYPEQRLLLLQVASTLIAAFGFGGYAPPPQNVSPCSLCLDSQGRQPLFWPSGTVPIAGTEGRFTASVIGCTYWVIVAWIWWAPVRQCNSLAVLASLQLCASWLSLSPCDAVSGASKYPPSEWRMKSVAI